MAVGDASQTSIRLEGKFGANVICWILGVGSLISWNSLTSIEDYYYDVFPGYHPSRVLTLVYQPFAFGTMAFAAYNESKIDTRRRNIVGYIIFFVGTLALILVDLVTSGKGSIGSYMGICSIVAAFGFADALIQGGMLGDLALMCPELIQSFLAGMAAAGALTSALRLVTKAFFDNIDDGLRRGALLFLSISTFFEFFCIFLYAFVFAKLPIVKFYRSKAALEGFLYENTGEHQLGSWYPLVLVATFNLWDLISRYIPLIQCLKLESRKGLLTIVLLRFFLVPAFSFTAKYADQGWMIMLVSVLGLSNGYLAVCVLMAAPKGYKGPEQNALGNLLVFFLLGGIFLGAALDWLWLIGNGSF